MISFNNVSVSFNGKPVLKDFSLNISEGEKVVITGRSGIGKSTILKLALGFLKPEKGSVSYLGRPYSREVVLQIRRDSAYISQDMEIGEGNIGKYLDQVFSFRHNSSVSGLYERIPELISGFELPAGLLTKNIEELSGGEKQRLMMMTAILLNRKIFFLDEITSALDVNLRHKIIARFAEEKEWTELIISHDSGWLGYGNVKNVILEEINAGI